MNNKLLILILVIAMAATAWSQELNPRTISGGGGEMESADGTIKLFDIKCTPFTGIMDVFYPPEEEVGPPAALTIKRFIDDIEISWPSDMPDPDIYYLVGTGQGDYDDNYGAGWLLATEAAGFDIGDLALDKIVHPRQADGEGEMEVYYKAVPPGFDPDFNTDNLSFFATAPAVGKVNIDLYSDGLGYNYVSVPFDYEQNTIKDVLDPSYLDVGTLVFAQMIAFDFDIAEVNASKVWVSAFEATKSTDIGSIFYVLPVGSYMVKVPTDIRITVVGNVLRGDEGKTLQILGNDVAKSNTYTYFGNFYPKQFNLSEADVNTRLKLTGVAVGDRIFYPMDRSFNFNIAYFDNGWKNEFDKNVATDITLHLPLGYMYKRNGASFNWTR